MRLEPESSLSSLASRTIESSQQKTTKIMLVGENLCWLIYQRVTGPFFPTFAPDVAAIALGRQLGGGPQVFGATALQELKKLILRH